MAEYRKGLLLGLGTITPILFIVLLAAITIHASTFSTTDTINSNNPVSIDVNTDKTYVWVEDKPAILKQQASNIHTINTGVVVGTKTVSYDGGKTFVQIPDIRPGYVITFKTVPDIYTIEKIDIEMSARGLVREGGKSISDKLTER